LDQEALAVAVMVMSELVIMELMQPDTEVAVEVGPMVVLV
jgi:hypothetical protein